MKWREIVFSFQGIALACWTYDLLTTYYAVDVTGLAVEVNPLGWPLGILGALAYYGPTVILSYFSLFKIKEKISLYASIIMTVVMLYMGSLNLIAGAQNYKIFVYTVTISPNIYYGLLALILTINFGTQLALKHFVFPPKTNVNLSSSEIQPV